MFSKEKGDSSNCTQSTARTVRVYSVVHVIKWNMSLNFKDEMLAFNDM
jgi:hypothetical protein